MKFSKHTSSSAGGVDKTLTPLLDPESGPYSGPYSGSHSGPHSGPVNFFWRKKNMTAHAKTCINAVRTRMRLFHQETQANALSNGPAFFPNAPSFFSNVPTFFSQLVPYQRRLELFFERT